MNRNIKVFITVLTLFVMFVQFIPVSADTGGNIWKEIYVSASGSDSGSGSKESPFKTIEKAKSEAQKLSESMQGDIVINIGGGYYFLEDTLRFGVADSGKNGHRIIYRGEKGNMPVVSGGFEAGTFTLMEGSSNIWQTKVENADYIRELYVNEKKAYMASTNHTVKGTALYKEENSIYEADGMYMSKEDFGIYENADDMEFKWAQGWVTTVCGVNEILQDPEDMDKVIVKMDQSWWDYQMVTGGTNGNGAKFNRDFVAYNAFELLDRPGEFYYNRKTQMLYYMPRADENMATAKVIIPKLERLININGNDIDDKVKNISFEGIKFAHATWYYPAEEGFMNVQQQSLGYGAFGYVPGTIALNRSDGIEFKGNYFFGFASTGVDMENATENTLVSGNAFSDIGQAAIVAGRGYHGEKDGNAWVGQAKNIPPAVAPSEFNLANGTEVITASYFGRDEANNITKMRGTQFWAGENEIYTGTVTWRSDPAAVAKGEKSWVKYDFSNPYSLSRIILTFNAQDVKDEQKTGFEVLLSNDRNFKNYVTVATQVTPAQTKQSYTDIPEGKYRYMMVRTLGATDFALSKVYVFTPDVELFTVAEQNEFNTVENNYIRRSDDYYYGGAAISGYYNHDYKVRHNEIIDTAYSGIIQGWGWNREATGSYNNDISYNYIENATQMLGDGAGIYTLSHQPNTHISHNVVRNLFQGNGAYYPDEGSSYEEWHDNVADNVLTNIHIWTDSIRYNKFTNLYSTQDTVNINSPYNEVEDIKIFIPGNPAPEAYVIMQEAGLEPEYEYLRDIVYDADMNLPDERERYHEILSNSALEERAVSASSKMAQNILDRGSFGSLPGEYPLEYKEKLKKGIEDISASGGDERVERIVQLRKLVNEAADAVIHMELPDMIAYCEEIIENASYSVSKTEAKGTMTLKVIDKKTVPPVLGAYSASSLAEFANEVRFAKKEYEEGLTKAKEYERVLMLEKAFRTFARGKASADIEYINVKNASKVTVDEENKLITAYFPYNVKLDEVEVEVIPFGDGEVARVIKTLNLNKECIIPVYSKTAKAYAYWKVVAKKGSDIETELGWFNRIDNLQTATLTCDGKVNLAANLLPYFRKGKASSGEEANISFKPLSSYDINLFTVYFGVNSMMAEKYGKEIDDNRFEIEVKNNTATVYYYNEGMKSAIADIKFPVIYNEYNSLAIKTTAKGNQTLLEAWLNGNQVLNVLSDTYLPDGGYIGLGSDKLSFETNKY